MSVQLSFDFATPSDQASKRCSRCGAEKPLSAFRTEPRYRCGVFYICMECEKAKNHARYSSLEYRIYSRARASTDEYRAAKRTREIKRRYGITQADYEAMRTRQGGVCGICGSRANKLKLAVDHDHACCRETARSCGNCLRALLCGPCNQLVGWMEVNGIQNEYTDTWRLRISREISNPWDELVSA